MAVSLMYHNIVESENDRTAMRSEHRRYCLTREAFTAQLDLAVQMGKRFMRPDEVLSEGAGDPAGVLVTFDDSWREHEWAAAALSARGIAAIFFLNSACLGREGMLSAGAVARVAAGGHEIGSHGAGHDFFTQMGREALRASLAGSKKRLEALGGREVRFLSAPGGRWDARVAATAREAGYRALFTSRPGFLRRADGQFALNRIAVTADINPRHFRHILTRPGLAITRRLARYELARLVRAFTE